MTFKNIYGRKGSGEFAGYPSLNEYRKARRLERLKEVQARIDGIEAMEKREDDHFRGWIEECCIEHPKLNGQEIWIEQDTKSLLASYRAWCKRSEKLEKTARKWGLWMGQHYVKVARNAEGIGRVYIGIALNQKELYALKIAPALEKWGDGMPI